MSRNRDIPWGGAPPSFPVISERPRPTVSVCTPTFQGVTRLRRIAPRLLAALGPGDEWIISVDGSTDGTSGFVEDLSRGEPRVCALLAPKNRGRTAALNAACRRASKDIVLRLDDDILVEPDFIERHAAVHAAEADRVGVVQPIEDLIEGEQQSGRWSAFVERNAALDADRLARRDCSLPATVWGPVCSVRRDVGAELGWYDERFAAYGWEDVEFGYRLRLAGIRLMSEPLAKVGHLVHWTTFKRKFERGFEAGARMALFATIHGPDAVLVALGRDPRDYAVPRQLKPGQTAARIAARSEGALARLAILAEAGLASMPSRRAYDHSVARLLNWAYARGWAAEVTRRSLPAIPAPPSWRLRAQDSWEESWRRIAGALTQCSAPPSGAAEHAAVRALARSAFLRTLERDVRPVRERWREAAGAAFRAAQQCLSNPPREHDAEAVDVLVVVDAATPSIMGRGIAAAQTASRNDLRAHVVCATPAIAAKVREVVETPIVSSIGEWIPASGRARRFDALVRSIPPARRAMRRYAGVVRLPLLARAQLVAEGVLALSRLPACRAVIATVRPAVVVSASEYFDVGAAAVDAAQAAGVPFVTLQHGAVNLVFTPFFADRYVVWSRGARDALVALDPKSERLISIATDGTPLEYQGIHDTLAAAELRRSLGVSSSTPLLGVYSQTHGAEFSAATHFTLAAQLDHLLAAHPDLMVAIKRHPSERRSIYESLLAGPHGARVTVTPGGVDARAFATACNAVCALQSTALRDAMAAGCPAIELLSADSLVRQPLAVLRLPVTGLETAVSRLLRDDDYRSDLLHRQREAQYDDVHAGNSLVEVLQAYCDRVAHA